MKLKLIWHEPSNLLAVLDLEYMGLPLMTVLDDEYKAMNPVCTYPFVYLKVLGWIELGEV